MDYPKPLPKEVQFALARQAKAGDVAARNRLVATSMGIAYKAAHRWVHSASGLEVDDLASEGALGLMHAIEKFDPDRGFTFVTWRFSLRLLTRGEFHVQDDVLDRQRLDAEPGAVAGDAEPKIVRHLFLPEPRQCSVDALEALLNF